MTEAEKPMLTGQGSWEEGAQPYLSPRPYTRGDWETSVPGTSGTRG